MGGEANLFCGKVHIATGKPFLMVAVEYEHAVEKAVERTQKTSDAVLVFLVEMQYFLAEHDPVRMDEKTGRHRIGIFQVQPHGAHDAFGLAYHAIVFAFMEQVMKF